MKHVMNDALDLMPYNILGHLIKIIPKFKINRKMSAQYLSCFLQYSLGSELDASFFAVNHQTGMITAKRKLDREYQKEYTFSVLATGECMKNKTG